MHIVFVHTPMATVSIPEREVFWRNFDIRYHATHPGLRQMKNVLWELPHWMTWLAGVLVNAGFTSLEAMDLYASECTMTGIDSYKIEQAIQKCPGDIYLLSPMTPNLPFAYEIADAIKRVSPESKVIFGGVVATPMHKEIAAHPSIDYVVFGRGEISLPALLKTLDKKEGPEFLGNLSFKLPGGRIHTSHFEYPWVPVNEIPSPKIDLFERSVGEDIRYLRQVYALGCPYKCSFCTIQTIGRKADYFALDRVIEEISIYREYYGSHHNVYFGDETFTVNKDRTLDICAALKNDGTIRYDIQTRLNCLNDSAMLRALKESGCSWVEIGIESVNQDTQNLHKQKVKLKELEHILAKVQDHGLATCSFLVNGFPDQTVDDMYRSIDYACDLIDKGLLQASYLFGLVPYPGSELFAEPARFGMDLLHKDFRYYHEELPPVYSTKYAEPEEIYKVFLYGVKSIGEVMGKKSKFLDYSFYSEKANYGKFWSEAHV
ncbi:TPA: radical SAM protein [Pseudomonas aeruginosa]|uniref:B12-binding domain-containing radical SAM protein n=1 Tax=Pseudomonas aeruginosa TaxID=287 RepID=UPI0009A2B3B8|nr:radical SAM protein [Pseudomonas aeruginosa]AVE36525.1 radical SAM protein [Pseudomonas aeruginosa]EKX6390958.1 radical SAM protein [Pseudomonas aeruginosa]ELL2377066.1 radical SAM protein [Pseudomonas aeruginosa]KAA5630114.1 radical SAM protein [Pseudomonas aeruginosa]MBI7021142.1 radical SAM protein [Pseudomonas aeruginosa]